jgi:hypothetical protein
MGAKPSVNEQCGHAFLRWTQECLPSCYHLLCGLNIWAYQVRWVGYGMRVATLDVGALLSKGRRRLLPLELPLPAA